MRISVIFISALLMSVMCPLADAREITISTGGWPPYLTQGQAHNGFIGHLIGDIFAEAGVTVHFIYRPWARIYQETAEGVYDATAVWMDAPERHGDFHYSQPVLDETFVFFYLQENGFDWQDFIDLKGKKLGGDLGYSYGPGFDAALESGIFQMERLHDAALNFRKLLHGRIALYPQEKSVGYFTLRQTLPAQETAKITHHPKPLLVNQSFVMFPREKESSRELLSIFNRGLAEFKKDGRYQAYFEAFSRGEYSLKLNE